MGSDWHTPATQIAKETHGLAPEQMSPGIPRGTHVPLTTSQKLRGLSQVAPPELQAWPSGTKAMQVRGAESGTQASPGKQSPIDWHVCPAANRGRHVAGAVDRSQ